MKSNKKGMTLVECIIAMAVFAIATTGFTMAATACMKAQAKSASRMTKTNTQSTNLEHFSSFTHVLDPEYSNIRPMTSGTNRWKMTYDFGTDVIVNDDVYGYYAKLDDSKDKVFELSFFTAADQVSLDANQYWVTLYNWDSEQHTWDLSCDQAFTFFDNEKNKTAQQTQPRHIWGPNGGYYKFGIEQLESSGNLSSCLTIKVAEDNSTLGPFGITEDMITDDRIISIYYDGEAFLSASAFEAKYGS